MTQLFYDPGEPKGQGAKVMIATTSYDEPSAAYTYSIQKARAELESKEDLTTAYLLLVGNCHVDDSRNSVVAHFLASDCSELFFIDADVSFTASDIANVFWAQFYHDEPEPNDIFGGVYPFRRPSESWPQEMPVRPMPGAEIEDGVIEVEGLPTGFMCIPRELIERMAADAEHFSPKPGRDPVPLLFERSVLDGHRLGGDIGFCKKARERYGARCFAAVDLRLGHTGSVTVTGSLAASIRAKNGTLLPHVVERIRAGIWRIEDLQDAFDHVGNRWGCPVEVLAFVVAMAAKADGPIVETGSGLSTILIAAATDQPVYALEHSEEFALRLERLAYEAGGGFGNLAVVRAPIVNRWYDPSDFAALPSRFAFGFIDGPPRMIGDRSVFFDALADRCDSVICDDAPSFEDAMMAYAAKRGWTVRAREERAMWIGKEPD